MNNGTIQRRSKTDNTISIIDFTSYAIDLSNFSSPAQTPMCGRTSVRPPTSSPQSPGPLFPAISRQVPRRVRRPADDAGLRSGLRAGASGFPRTGGDDAAEPRDQHLHRPVDDDRPAGAASYAGEGGGERPLYSGHDRPALAVGVLCVRLVLLAVSRGRQNGWSASARPCSVRARKAGATMAKPARRGKRR